MSRLRTLRSGTTRTLTIATAIRAAADNPAITVVRLQLKYTRHHRPYRHVQAWTAKFWNLGLDRDAIDVIDLLIRSSHPDIDWRFDHDWHLDTGMLRCSPRVVDNGYIPEDDKTFGGGAPLFLPRPGDTGEVAA